MSIGITTGRPDGQAKVDGSALYPDDIDAPDALMAKRALLRSRHNNYLTLPVLFIMISIHYPVTYGQDGAWLILLALSLAGVSIRHWFNTRHLEGKGPAALLAGLALLILVAAWTAPTMSPGPTASDQPQAVVSNQAAMEILRSRCVQCHAGEYYDKAANTDDTDGIDDADETDETDETGGGK